MDALSIFLYAVFGFLLLIIIIVGLSFLRSIFRGVSSTKTETIQHSSNNNQKNDESIRKESEGDGLILFDDPMFPAEFDENDADNFSKIKEIDVKPSQDRSAEESVITHLANESFADELEPEGKAYELERAGKFDEASKMYLEDINKGFIGSFPFDRLRIIYSKQKQWSKAAAICKRYSELDASYFGFDLKSRRMLEFARKYESRANRDTAVLTADSILAKSIEVGNTSLKKKPLTIPNYRVNKPFPFWARGQVKLQTMHVPPFEMYFPSENQLSFPQSSFYTRWKRGWKEGKPIDVQGNISYLFAYTYGVLGSITLKPQETINELRLLQHVYKNETKFCMYLSFWIFNAYLMLSDYLTAIAFLESREGSEKIDTSDHLILSLKYKLGLPMKGEDLLNLSLRKSKIILNNKDLVLPLLDRIIEDFEEKNDVDLLSFITQKFAFLENTEYYLFPGQSVVKSKIRLDIYNYKAIGDFNVVINQWLRDVENKIRVQLKLPKIGEGWISESMVLNLTRKLFSPLGYDVIHNSFPAFLEGLQLDIYIPSLKLGIEYMGKQHYEPIDFFGGQESYLKLKQRDQKKMKICKDNGVHLIYYKFDEPITEDYFKSKVEEYINRY